VNSILALTDLLGERFGVRADQKDELFYIRKSAQQLSDIVDDLLDLAKVEAGKIEVHPATFEVEALFGALRGMLRPLLVNQALALRFEEPDEIPPMYSDESKISQILRNFISNALKYTERGEVRVTAALTPARDAVEFRVADTGIGIPGKDLARIFDEFVQIENPLQRRVKGTGLGLPLSKRLAELLGGSITVDSTLGVGSTFAVTIPLTYRGVGRDQAAPEKIDPARVPLLVVEDSDEDALLFERALAEPKYHIFRARTTTEAESLLAAASPVAVVLDIRLHGSDAWDFLARMKRDPTTSARPVIVVSTVDDRRKGFALGADAYSVKPLDAKWLLQTLDGLASASDAVRVLAIDDEEASRFIIRQMLKGTTHQVIEAASGGDGLRHAREGKPDVILLDLRLTDMTGFDLFERLRAHPSTARVPVLVVTSQRLTEDDRARLSAAKNVLSKSSLTREGLRVAIADALSSARAEQGTST
jgi:CheY-like chemotaxis protein